MEVDGFYMYSFEIWLACTVVFPGAGTIAFTILEFRLGKRSLLGALVENCTWIPFLCVHIHEFMMHFLVLNIFSASSFSAGSASTFLRPYLFIYSRIYHMRHDEKGTGFDLYYCHVSADFCNRKWKGPTSSLKFPESGSASGYPL